MRRLAEVLDTTILVATIAFVVIGATVMGLASLMRAARSGLFTRVTALGSASQSTNAGSGARLA